MTTNETIQGQLFISGPLAMTDIHNGGTIFGIIYYELLEFSSEQRVTLKNTVTFNRGMKGWQDQKESESWEGVYEVASDNKHVFCNLHSNKNNRKRRLYADFADGATLLCEEYEEMGGVGQGRVFSKYDK
jgi:hypothetical protein